MKRLDKILFFIIVSLPIIDILTAFTASLSISFGMVARMLLLIFLCYIVWRIFSKDAFYLVWIGLSIMTIGITFGLALLFKQPFYFLEEITFMFKTIYYVMAMFSILALIRIKWNSSIILLALKIVAITIGASFWIAFLTKTNLKSYAYIKSGFTGWFFSANELSVILILLFSCTIINLIKNINFSSYIVFFLLLSMTPMIGTKTAFYGGVMLLFFYLVYLFIKPRQKGTVIVFATVFLFVFALPYTPYMANTEENVSVNEEVKQTTITKSTQPLLSSRDVYLKQTLTDYKKASLYQQLFGFGYGGNYTKAPKTIEMDFYDLFFSYGIVGTIILLLPFYFIGKQIMYNKLTFTYIFSLFTLALCGGISFVAGHVLFAPAVMSYIVIFAILTNLEGQTTI